MLRYRPQAFDGLPLTAVVQWSVHLMSVAFQALETSRKLPLACLVVVINHKS